MCHSWAQPQQNYANKQDTFWTHISTCMQSMWKKSVTVSNCNHHGSNYGQGSLHGRFIRPKILTSMIILTKLWSYRRMILNLILNLTPLTTIQTLHLTWSKLLSKMIFGLAITFRLGNLRSSEPLWSRWVVRYFSSCHYFMYNFASLYCTMHDLGRESKVITGLPLTVSILKFM